MRDPNDHANRHVHGEVSGIEHSNNEIPEDHFWDGHCKCHYHDFEFEL